MLQIIGGLSGVSFFALILDSVLMYFLQSSRVVDFI